MTAEQIFAQLRDPGKQIPREALTEIVQRREEFVPLLLAEIEAATQLADEAGPDDLLPSFSLYLLAQLREPRALEPILAFFALDGTTDEDLFGDVITQNGAAILAAVGADNPARLREYARHRNLSLWVRAAVLDALVRQALWGEQPRESVVQYFSELFETNAFGNDTNSWTALVNACMDLHPRELLDLIRPLYERELVDIFIVGDFDAIEEEAAEDPEEHHRRQVEYHPPITDAGEAVSWWQCFARPRPLRHRINSQDLPPLPPLPDVPGVTIRHEQPKISRNDLCPCGSGKKYKKCCLKSA